MCLLKIRRQANKKITIEPFSAIPRETWLAALMAISPTDKIKAANQLAFDAGRNLRPEFSDL